MNESSFLFFLHTQPQLTGQKFSIGSGDCGKGASLVSGKHVRVSSFFELLGTMTGQASDDVPAYWQSLTSEQADAEENFFQNNDGASFALPYFSRLAGEPALVKQESGTPNPKASENLLVFDGSPADSSRAAVRPVSSGDDLRPAPHITGEYKTFGLASGIDPGKAGEHSWGEENTIALATGAQTIRANWENANVASEVTVNFFQEPDVSIAKSSTQLQNLSHDELLQSKAGAVTGLSDRSEAQNQTRTPAFTAADLKSFRRSSGWNDTVGSCEQGEQTMDLQTQQQTRQSSFSTGLENLSSSMNDSKVPLSALLNHAAAVDVRIELVGSGATRSLIKNSKTAIDSEMVPCGMNSPQNVVVEDMEMVRTPAKPSGPEIIQQVAQKASIAFKDGNTEISLHLKPEHLGHLHIKIAAEENQVHVRIVADVPIVKETLEHHVELLKSAMEAHGLEVDSFEVCVAQDGEQDTGRRGEASSQHAPAWLLDAAEEQGLGDDDGEERWDMSHSWNQAAGINCFA
ncbi:MAG TPA: flagellar hook-length control protein FliK [Thermodesulfobacteriota bacterium]|nr:flagellar hook-length control protein FliK [Thermodesulfobacteriota bacterium]HOC38011.1 flagellar hook-length control protein FliK [Thermodesulfobacteriota bacterium]